MRQIVRWAGAVTLCTSSVAFAQSGVAVLRGTVTDPTGAYIPSARISVHCEGGRSSDSASSADARGRYEVTVASGAPCEMTGSSPGFATFRRIALRLEQGVTIEQNVMLQIGSVGPYPVHVADQPEVAAEATRSSSLISAPTVQTAPPTVSFHELSPVATATKGSGWEYGGIVQGGFGLQDRTNFSFLLVGGHVGKVLTGELGTGLFKGNFEMAAEVFPLWQSYTPKFQRITCVPNVLSGLVLCSGPYTVGGTFTGASVTPVIFRWNFTHGKQWMPWIQGAGGVVWTNHKYPAVGDLNPLDPTQTGPQANTSVWNFTPQGGVGTHYFVKPGRSYEFSLNAVHISSSSLGDKNPGVNVSVQASVGYTWWK